MTSRLIPQPVCTSTPIHDRKSTFVAAIYRAASSTTAQATAKHVKDVVHTSNPASHNMMAYRTMSLKPGHTGLHGPEDFEVRGKSIGLTPLHREAESRAQVRLEGGYEDDGEKYGGSRALKIMQREGVLDAVVVVSRWYGGIMLGPVRFTHIEDCTHEVCVRFKAIEELQERVAHLQNLDQTLVDLRATLAKGVPGTPSNPQDYSALVTSSDLAKVHRLIKARENAIRSVESVLREKSKDAALNSSLSAT